MIQIKITENEPADGSRPQDTRACTNEVADLKVTKTRRHDSMAGVQDPGQQNTLGTEAAAQKSAISLTTIRGH
jgi:hypothetical protein